jgi:hypothetical protein
MSVRMALIVAAAVSLSVVSLTQQASGAAAPLDYNFFKTQVEPIFMKKRAGHARCVQCHTEANNFMRLERLAPGQTTWNEEQSKKMFDSISKLVSPANRAESRLLIHPLAPEAGGDLFHSGGRQFDSKDDPDYKILMRFAGVQ